LSPLERRLLLAMVSHMRDRMPDFDRKWRTADADGQLFLTDWVPLGEVYERCDGNRQAMRRALGRLHPRYVSAAALAWVNLEDQEILCWQGGGSKKRYGPKDYQTTDTPRWRIVCLTPEGVEAALKLEQEGT
jgi:hypothetical protein